MVIGDSDWRLERNESPEIQPAKFRARDIDSAHDSRSPAFSVRVAFCGAKRLVPFGRHAFGGKRRTRALAAERCRVASFPTFTRIGAGHVACPGSARAFCDD